MSKIRNRNLTVLLPVMGLVCVLLIGCERLEKGRDTESEPESTSAGPIVTDSAELDSIATETDTAAESEIRPSLSWSNKVRWNVTLCIQHDDTWMEQEFYYIGKNAKLSDVIDFYNKTYNNSFESCFDEEGVLRKIGNLEGYWTAYDKALGSSDGQIESIKDFEVEDGMTIVLTCHTGESETEPEKRPASVFLTVTLIIKNGKDGKKDIEEHFPYSGEDAKLSSVIDFYNEIFNDSTESCFDEEGVLRKIGNLEGYWTAYDKALGSSDGQIESIKDFEVEDGMTIVLTCHTEKN